MRAYNFEAKLVEMIGTYVYYLMNSSKVRDINIYQMRTYLEKSLSKLEFKAQNDPNLTDNQEFKNNLAELNNIFSYVK